MILRDRPKNLEEQITGLCPAAAGALRESSFIAAQMLPYQAMALYALAARYNVAGTNILEIGTAAGFSASIMAQAAPKARIITLNPRDWEVKDAQRNLSAWPNVTVVEAASWDYLKNYTGPDLDMVFVDGDHNRVNYDLPWFNELKPGGLFLFHDYSEVTCRTVYDTVNLMAKKLGRNLDVSIIDTNFIGMAGLYRQDGEGWQI
jgi:predicted O-methyltransferase YrrM